MTTHEDPGYYGVIALGSDTTDLCHVTVNEIQVIPSEDGDDLHDIGEPVTDPAPTGVRADVPQLRDITDAAEAILRAAGWTVTGPWEDAGNAFFAQVERTTTVTTTMAHHSTYPVGSVERGMAVILETIAEQGFNPESLARFQHGDETVDRLLSEGHCVIRVKTRVTRPDQTVRHLVFPSA